MAVRVAVKSRYAREVGALVVLRGDVRWARNIRDLCSTGVLCRDTAQEVRLLAFGDAYGVAEIGPAERG